MTLEIASFIFGGLLILIGLLGGGFEVKEIKVPKVRLPSRLISAVVGIIFVALGVALHSPSNLPVEPPTTMVHFQIRDELGTSQVSEQVRVTIDERFVGTITVSKQYPLSEISVSVPREATYSYQLVANAVSLNEEGQELEYTGVGRGNINVKSGKTYHLLAGVSGNTWQTWLEEAR